MFYLFLAIWIKINLIDKLIWICCKIINYLLRMKILNILLCCFHTCNYHLLWMKICYILLRCFHTCHYHLYQWVKILKFFLISFHICHYHHHHHQQFITNPPSTKNSQSSQTFPLMPQNTFNVFHKPPNNCRNAQTPSNEEVDTQFPTQIELEDIIV